MAKYTGVHRAPRQSARLGRKMAVVGAGTLASVGVMAGTASAGTTPHGTGAQGYWSSSNETNWSYTLVATGGDGGRGGDASTVCQHNTLIDARGLLKNGLVNQGSVEGNAAPDNFCPAGAGNGAPGGGFGG